MFRALFFLLPDFFAADFPRFAADFLVDFLAADFFAVDFFAFDLFAVDFFAVDFFAFAFFAVDVLAADFFAPDFFAADFRGAAFFFGAALLLEPLRAAPPPDRALEADPPIVPMSGSFIQLLSG